MIEVQNLSMVYPMENGSVQAVDGISFRVEPAEFFTLLGPSGSGKSTTLRCIAGLEKPINGEVLIDGAPVFSSTKNVWVPPERRLIGMVFQSYAVWPHMDVFGNVSFPLVHGVRRQHLGRKELAAAVAEALSLVQLSGMERRKVSQLSGGQQQRVALARALIEKPRVLLMDEPLSNLDAKLREVMRLEIRALCKRVGATVVYVTHDQAEALSVSDRLAVLMDGKVLQVGTPRAVYAQPVDRVVAAFVGSMNMLNVQEASLNGMWNLQTEIGPLLAAPEGERPQLPNASGGQPLLALIRPENVECSKDASPDAKNVFQGTVRQVVYQGTVVELAVDVGGFEFRIVQTPHEDIREGDQVHISLPPQYVMLMN